MNPFGSDLLLVGRLYHGFNLAALMYSILVFLVGSFSLGIRVPWSFTGEERYGGNRSTWVLYTHPQLG